MPVHEATDDTPRETEGVRAIHDIEHGPAPISAGETVQ